MDNVDQNSEQENIEQSLKQCNFAALIITPLWLLRNGFWVTMIVYMVAMAIFFPLALLLSILFCFKGNRWSWSNGNRWKSFDAFASSQSAWNQFAVVCLILQGVALLFRFNVL